jgi:hypothetical protein
MSQLLLRLSRAVDNGRAASSAPSTREQLLVTLLNKRAAARNVGADELENMLRAQILWSLPTFAPVREPVDAELAA